MSETPPTDERTEDDLENELAKAGWETIGPELRATFGVTLLLRKRGSTDASEADTKRASGVDRKEAIRDFLAELATGGEE